MTLLRALHLLLPVRILPFLLPVSAAIAQTDASALQWLQRIYSATQKLSYTGTFVYQQGQQVETSRITHLVDASGPHEKIESLDGVPREIIRNRDEVVCYLPATMTVKIDKQPGWRSFPAILPEQLKGLSENYRVKKAEVERVAGYDCQVIVLEPKDRMRYGHRLWADLNTGMLLKAKTLDDRNVVIEQFTFTQLRVGGPIDRDKVKSRFARPGRDWNIENSEATRVSLADAGWIIKSMPPGFRTVAELTRTLGGTSGVGHIVVSDGLAAVSVFIEPVASKQRTPQPGLVRQGAINVYMRPVGGYWVTVVGETPPESVKYIGDAVEYRK
ncbi:MAG: MucB/RseB C-terminal domain-containing protein [Burkholderiales bacterium]